MDLKYATGPNGLPYMRGSTGLHCVPDFIFTIIKNDGIYSLIDTLQMGECTAQKVIFESKTRLIEDKRLAHGIDSTAVCLKATEDELVFDKNGHIYKVRPYTLEWNIRP